MILIADSGSTKTDWRLIDEENKIHQFKTTGINPYFHSSESITEALTKELLPNIKFEIRNLKFELFFYGAGCSSDEKCNIVKRGLQSCFSKPIIEVEHDLLAAARALCGHDKGIAAILGTGSNSCYYNGKDIIENVVSLGYVLGDEGSGAYMGKKLIQYYLYKELPEDLDKIFFEKYKLTKDEVLENVYKKPNPNRYLASFSPFLQHNLSHHFIAKLVYDSFSDFFEHHICKYAEHKQVKMHCTGSVGFYFANILRQVATDRAVAIDKITESPIAGLTLYHLNER